MRNGASQKLLWKNSSSAPLEKACYTETVAQTHSLYFFAVFTTVMVWGLKEGIYTAVEVNQFVANNNCSKCITVSKMECGEVISFQDTVSVYFMKIIFSFLLSKEGKWTEEISRCSTYCLIMSLFTGCQCS